MNSEIVSIGDEILIGQIANTNAKWMAQQLNLIGIAVKQITTVGDNREDLLKILSESMKRSNIILLTGGLGPTSDDITKQVLCEFFNTKLVFDEHCFEDVKRIFIERNLRMPEINRGQAEVPENCIPIRNKYGTAPGMWFELSIGNKTQKENLSAASTLLPDCIFVSLPGVPYEMKAMMNGYVIPKLREYCQGNFIIHKTIVTQGIGESALAEKIKLWEDYISKEMIKLAYLPSPGMVKLRLSASGKDLQSFKNLDGLIKQKISELSKIIPEYFIAVEEFGEEQGSLEKIIGEILRQKNKTIAIAESCTGGYISHLITSVPGSSDYFKGGIIAYSNEVKKNFLNVNNSVLEIKGAVSKESAEQMAEGVRKQLSADIGVATTGIAGPAGGSAEKPVGTVWISVSSEEKIISKKFDFGPAKSTDSALQQRNIREINIRKAALSALNMLRTLLNN